MNNSKTKKLVMAALLAALCCVATMIIKIPSPLKGYLNLGDCVVLLSGWLLSPVYGFLAAGLGSALADIFSGYVTYAPATFVIKGLMALIAYYGFKIVMVLGYLVFEGFLYGLISSIVNISANAVQGVAGIIIGTILIRIFDKNKIMMD